LSLLKSTQFAIYYELMTVVVLKSTQFAIYYELMTVVGSLIRC